MNLMNRHERRRPDDAEQTSADQESERSDADAELQREILRDRKFSLAEAIGRMAGPGAMKGESPITRLQQAEVEIETWLRYHLLDAGEGLQVALLRGVKRSDILLQSFEQPLAAFSGYCQQVLDSDYRLQELVRDADVEWGRVFEERPYLDRPGAAAHADDPYTIESVRGTLCLLIKQLPAGPEQHPAPGVTEQSPSP
jgi:hypothetical protein